MAVGAHHDQVGPGFSGAAVQHLGHRGQRLGQHHDLGLDAVPGQHLAQRPARVRAFGRMRRGIDDGDLDQVGGLEDRAGAADRGQRLVRLVPGDDDPPADAGHVALAVRQDQHRAVAVEQRRLDHRLGIGGGALAIGLGQHHQIGESRPLRDQRADAAHLRHGAFGRPADVLGAQMAADLGFQRLGRGHGAVDRLLEDIGRGAGVVIAGLGVVHAQAEHVQMRVLAARQRHRGVQLGGLTGLGDDGQDGLVAHVHFLRSIRAKLHRRLDGFC